AEPRRRDRERLHRVHRHLPRAPARRPLLARDAGRAGAGTTAARERAAVPALLVVPGRRARDLLRPVLPRLDGSDRASDRPGQRQQRRRVDDARDPGRLPGARARLRVDDAPPGAIADIAADLPINHEETRGGREVVAAPSTDPIRRPCEGGLLQPAGERTIGRADATEGGGIGPQMVADAAPVDRAGHPSYVLRQTALRKKTRANPSCMARPVST